MAQRESQKSRTEEKQDRQPIDGAYDNGFGVVRKEDELDENETRREDGVEAHRWMETSLPT